MCPRSNRRISTRYLISPINVSLSIFKRFAALDGSISFKGLASASMYISLNRRFRRSLGFIISPPWNSQEKFQGSVNKNHKALKHVTPSSYPSWSVGAHVQFASCGVFPLPLKFAYCSSNSTQASNNLRFSRKNIELSHSFYYIESIRDKPRSLYLSSMVASDG